MGVPGAILCAAIVMGVTTLLVYHSQFPQLEAGDLKLVTRSGMHAPDLAFDHERGDVAMAIEYLIPPERAGEFVALADALRHLRLRNGGRYWGLFRDTHDERIWREMLLVESWLQHLRMLDRMTLADKALIDRVRALHAGEQPPRITLGVTYESIRYGDNSAPGST
ncbi:MAG: MFS transporter [Dyella sp.]|nr:MFS transporter [Dyella sp.]